MSDSFSRENEPGAPGQAWLEVREGALRWIAAKRPAWWHDGDKSRPNAGRIIADTGLHRMTVYRFKDLQGVPGPARLEADNIARLVALAARERGVTEGVAFSRLFKVVCPTDAPLAEAAA